MDLKPSHEMFVQELIASKGNATKSYLKVFPNAKYDSARHSASILLTNVYIKKRVVEIIEQNGIGLQDVVKKLSNYMNAKSTYYHESENGEKVYHDDKDTQFKALNLILRLYASLNIYEAEVFIKPEQVAKEQAIVQEEE